MNAKYLEQASFYLHQRLLFVRYFVVITNLSLVSLPWRLFHVFLVFGFECARFQLRTAGDPGLLTGDGETVRGKLTQERQL